MKSSNDNMQDFLNILPPEVQMRTRLSLGISKRIEELMHENGLNKKKFAEALGRRPSEITKWLSGEHNFTIGTLAMLSAYFNRPIIDISAD